MDTSIKLKHFQRTIYIKIKADNFKDASQLFEKLEKYIEKILKC